MDPGDLVRIKKGIGGLEPPNDTGILVHRERGGKDFMALVFTEKGHMKVKWKHLRGRAGKRYEGPLDDERAMRAHLEDRVKAKEKKSSLAISPKNIEDSVTLSQLWDSVTRQHKRGKRMGEAIGIPLEGCIELSMSPLDVGSVHFHGKELDPDQVGAVAKVLSGADNPDSPYFVRMDIERRARYVPYSRNTMEKVMSHVDRLESLRSRFLRWVEDDEDPKRRSPRLIVQDFTTVELGREDKEEMDRIEGWALAHLELGGWPTGETPLRSMEGRAEQFGLGGTPIRRVDTFDLERFLTYLFMDLLEYRRENLPSHLLEFLLRMGRITWRRGAELAVEYALASGRRVFHRDFPDHVVDASRRLAGIISDEERSKRLDLRLLETYTIDPEDARDFDDAISLVKEEKGTVVWVHIADVSHYVKPMDLVDSEARFRGTSVYLPTGVLPMLPPRLSEDLCSLTEGVDRLALSTRLVFDDTGSLIEDSRCQSVIRVDRNLTYAEVDEMIENGKAPFSELDSLARCIHSREERLDLETPERRIRFDGENSLSTSVKRPTPSTRLIEELMVLTNESSSRYLEERGYPLPYRVHPMPDRTSVERFNETCRALGLSVEIQPWWGEGDGPSDHEDRMLRSLLSGGSISLGGDHIADVTGNGDGQIGQTDGPTRPDPEEMREVVGAFNSALDEIGSIADQRIRDLLVITMLRTMPRAFYSTESIGHFGLGSGCYCHFTSPIRRYPDILVHRSIKAALHREGKGPEPGWNAPTVEEISTLLEHVNDMSGSAEEWEREMTDAALAIRYSMDRDLRHSVHTGLVTSITPGSLFLLLDDDLTEARMPLQSVLRRGFVVDEHLTRVEFDPELSGGRSSREFTAFIERTGGRTGRVLFRLAQVLGVSISSISVVDGRIEVRPGG